jgi:hypothetical protein
LDDPRSLCPLFLAPRDRANFVEQIASGVLLTLGAEMFVLTAAHAVDALDRGDLMLPGASRLLELEGTFHRLPLATVGSRDRDPVDFGFLRLTPELAAQMHPAFKPLKWDELGLFETLTEGDLYTFAGYPVSRAKVRGHRHESELFKYTGGAAPDDVYASIGCDPGLHVVMIFNRKRCIVGGNIQAAAHPRGLSGGGVFSWPKTARESLAPKGPRRLVAIAHTYLDQPGCMVATRINGCIAAILHHYPHADPLARRKGERSIPAAVVWYRESDWPAIKRDFVDAANMPETFNAWREAAQTGIETLTRRGTLAVPVPLTADEIARYCRATGQPNTGRTRGQFASKRLAEAILG